jgi:hypothetical protein
MVKHCPLKDKEKEIICCFDEVKVAGRKFLESSGAMPCLGQLWSVSCKGKRCPTNFGFSVRGAFDLHPQ